MKVLAALASFLAVADGFQIGTGISYRNGHAPHISMADTKRSEITAADFPEFEAMTQGAIATTGRVIQTGGTASAPMRYKKLGGSDIVVSEVCLGTMTWGNQNLDDDAMAQLNSAWDEYGINFLDTAEGYPIPLSAETQGRTDLAIGKWLKSTKRARDSVIISTKVSGRNDRYDWLRDDGESTKVSEKQITESVEKSLQRLGTDYIDVLHIHWPDRYLLQKGGQLLAQETVSFEEQVKAMGKLIEEGKVRAWALSNETPHGVRQFCDAARAAGVPKPVAIQNSYSLLTRQDEGELAALISPEREDISYLPYSPLSAGVLTGKYMTKTSALDETTTRRLYKALEEFKVKKGRLDLFPGYFERYLETEAPAAVAEYAKLALSNGITPTDLALAFCKSRDFATSTIIGATSMEQMHANMRAFETKWTGSLETGVDAIHKKYPDPWSVAVRNGG